MRQPSFSDIEYSLRKHTTKREEFLRAMDEFIPWDEWVAYSEPYYPSGQRGRPPMGIEKMLCMYLLQCWFNLSDAGEYLFAEEPDTFMKKRLAVQRENNPHLDETTTKYYGVPMSRVFKTRTFSRWMKKTLLTNQILLKAVDEMERGLIDADLGGNTLEDKVYKKRIALPGRGKSGSTRTIVATSKAGKWFFLYGFEKDEKDNISQNELISLRDTAEDWLSASGETLAEALACGKLEEILQ